MYIITPAIVSAIITAFLGPAIFYFLKRRDERRRKEFEVRYSEYKHYLRTLDEITAASRQDMEKFMHETVAETFNTIITEPVESDAALVELNSALLSMSSNMQQTFAKAEGELHGLKLVASEELLDMVNEYVELQRDILDESVKMMENWQEVDLGKSYGFRIR